MCVKNVRGAEGEEGAEKPVEAVDIDVLLSILMIMRASWESGAASAKDKLLCIPSSSAFHLTPVQFQHQFWLNSQSQKEERPVQQRHRRNTEPRTSSLVCCCPK